MWLVSANCFALNQLSEIIPSRSLQQSWNLHVNALWVRKQENFRGFFSIYQVEGGFPAQSERSPTAERVCSCGKVEGSSVASPAQGEGGLLGLYMRLLLAEDLRTHFGGRGGHGRRQLALLAQGDNVSAWPPVSTALLPSNSSSVICNPLLPQSRKMVSKLPKGSLCYF